MVNVEIINLNLWSQNCIFSFDSFHIHSCDLDIICDHWDHSCEIVKQKKYTHLKEVMKKSDKFSERIVERSTVITY
jgi:hypothetical protein